MKQRPTSFLPTSLRLILACVLLLGLLVRASLPVGFMPVFDDDHMVSIEICTGGDVKQMLVKASDMPDAPYSDKQHTNKSTCAYAMALAPSLAAIAEIVLPPNYTAHATIVALEIASQYRSLNRVYLAQGPPVA